MNDQNVADGGVELDGVTSSVDGFTPDVLAPDAQVLPDTSPENLAPDPANPGPFKVGKLDGSFDLPAWGTYKLTAYYPAKAKGIKTQPNLSQAPYPLVVFCHGYLTAKNVYKWVGNHLASWGFVTVLYSVPNNAVRDPQQSTDGFKNSIDWALDKSAGTGLLKGMVDPAKIGIAGHSQGGAASLWAAGQDSRPKALVAMSTMGLYQNKDPLIKIPVQLLVGSRDGFWPPWASQSHYDLLGQPKQIVVFEGANHMGYIDVGIEYDVVTLATKAGTFTDKTATMPHKEQLRLGRKYLTAWMSYFLKGDLGYTSYLFGNQAQQDISSGLITKNQHKP
jgi:predicted dienelactone hydrolase